MTGLAGHFLGMHEDWPLGTLLASSWLCVIGKQHDLPLGTLLNHA